MILACDEDVGVGVPTALKAVGLKAVISIPKEGHTGQPDTEWLTMVGRKKWLAFSFNKDMLNVPAERDVIIAEKVGIVFLTSGQERIHQVLRFLLNRWAWLEKIDKETCRPFAYIVSIKGRPTRAL